MCVHKDLFGSRDLLTFQVASRPSASEAGSGADWRFVDRDEEEEKEEKRERESDFDSNGEGSGSDVSRLAVAMEVCK